MTFRQMYQSWNDFWFKPISATTICLYRIILGMVAFAWGLTLAPNFLTWFGRHGLLSIRTIGIQSLGFRNAINPIVWFNPDNSVLLVLLGIYLAATICMTIGLCTRLSNLIVLLLMISFCNRNPFILNGGDALLRLNLFILLFAPAGKMFSIENRLRRRFATESQRNALYEPWTQRLLQIQLAILYWEAFWAKLNGHDWWDGTAVYYVMHLTEFHFMSVPRLFDQLWLCRLLSWGTMIFEMSMWSLIWVKSCKYWLFLIGFIVHMSFNWVLNIPMFQFIVLSNYIVFVEPADAQQVLSWLKKQWSIIMNALKPTLHSNTGS